MRRMPRLAGLLTIAVLSGCAAKGPKTASDTFPVPMIDRKTVVSRHDVIVHKAEPYGALFVGNGSFAFNFDITGLQTFPEFYATTTPLGILSTWGWHSFPNPDGFTPEKYPLKTIPKGNRTFSYPAAGTLHPTTQAAYLRSNPHRFGLGQIGLVMTKADGSPIAITDVHDINQRLSMWDGQADSSFTIEGQPVHVHTAASMRRDEVSVRVESPLISAGRLKVKIAFPYASSSFGPDYQDWSKPEAHATALIRSASGATFQRTLDDTRYAARVGWTGPDVTLNRTGKHEFVMTTPSDTLTFTAQFAAASMNDANSALGLTKFVEAEAARDWHAYWNEGGIIDFSGTADPRAAELERRLVLSQYLMAVHDSGANPPQETGLAANSWYGKFHMEMYWWHAAHWALWGHPQFLERSLDSLKPMMPLGEAMAKLQQCAGVKWPKMTDPSGAESPSGVGPVLVWQQPHPIYLAELAWRARRDDATLNRYKDIVFATADYMATFVDYDAVRKEYVLGPAVSPGDEKHTDVLHNMNPTMEVAYWKWTLQIAQQWRERLKLPRDAKWDDVINHFAKPAVRNGIYPALEVPPEDKPAFLTTFMYGAFPGPDTNLAVMRETLHTTKPPATQNAVTWGTSMAAMCAARLGEPERAVDLLVEKFETNPFRTNGYTVRRPEQTPMYMPANGGWLTAAAMMAAGWDGSTGHAPGFPKEWVVRYEGLLPLP